MRRQFLTAVATMVVLSAAVGAVAAPPRALPDGQRPADDRLGELRTLNDHFPFHVVESAEAWDRRADELRRRVLVSQGLWPMPTKAPLNAVVHGKVERDGYTVERVYFESAPGHYVTGSLYRPTNETDAAAGADGRRPAVLSPHGHWPDGRFHDHGPNEIRQLIATGAERFEVGGRHPLQARSVQLARMGCVVLLLDMVGYADSIQIDHRPGVREHMNTPADWGLFSPRAELHLQSMMGLQTWNAIRALDLLESLDDVDPDRIAVTGASGGATQTFLLAAVDDRPAAFLPAVMVSTAMQGGCTCENAPYLRIGAGNIDLAALTAPRPLALTAADDWTIELEDDGYPDLRALYDMLGHGDRFDALFRTDFPHNYNHVSRVFMYGFMNRHLGLGFDEPVLESDYQPLSRAEATVWTGDHPRPTGDQIGDEHERRLVRMWHEDSQRQLGDLFPRDTASLAEYRRIVGGAWDVMLGRRLDDVGEVAFDLTEKIEHNGYVIMTGPVTHAAPAGGREQLPTLYVHPRDGWNEQVVLWLTGTGKDALLDDAGEPKPHVARLVDAGYSVVGVDLIGQGEFTDDGRPLDATPLWHQPDGSAPWHHYAGYTFGYNHPLVARRAQDVLTMIHFVRTNEYNPDRVHLVGIGETAGPVAAAARAQAGDAIDRTAIHTAGFRFTNLDRFDHPMFLPGAAKYHDLDGLLSLLAPHPLWLSGEGERGPRTTRAAYHATDAPDRLTIEDAADAEDAAAWLMR